MTPDVAINEFLQAYLADRAAGQVPPLAHYLERWPDFAERISAEYTQLTGDAEAPAPRKRWIDHYEVRGVLGRGGQALVVEAWDEVREQAVAIKILQGLQGLSPQARRRFTREAMLLRRLDHPNICPVLGVGEHDDSPYLVMPRLEGATLGSRLDQARTAGGKSSAMPARDVLLSMMAAIARGVHHAHQIGIVHRDIKPDNIMVTPGGKPYLLDFGLAAFEAAAQGENQDLTRSGDVFGTPSYMSPELFLGGPTQSTEASDVYALGATLFECLSLQRPFEEATPEALATAVRTRGAPDLRNLVPNMDRDLAVVVATALHMRPEQRYASALAFAEDLERCRDKEPIKARPTRWPTRMRQWAERHPSVAILSTLLLLSLIGSSLWAAGALQRLEEQHRLAREDAERLRWQAYRADVAAAFARVQQGDPRGGARFLDATPEDLRAWEWRHGRWLVDRCERTIEAHGREGAFTVLREGGDRFLSFGWDTRGEPTVVRTWDPQTGAMRDEVTGVPVGEVYPAPDGQTWLIYQRRPGRPDFLLLWDRETAQSLWECEVEDARIGPNSPSFSPSGDRIVVGLSHALLVFDAVTGEVHRHSYPGVVIEPTFLEETRLLARVAIGEAIHVEEFKLADGGLQSRRFEAPEEGAVPLSVTPTSDGEHAQVMWARLERPDVAWGEAWRSAHLVTVIDILSGRYVVRVPAEATSFAWLRDANALVLGRVDGTVEIHEMRPGGRRAVLRGHNDPVRHIFLSADGEWLYTGTREGQIRIWSAHLGEQPFRGAPWPSRRASVAPHGDLVASGGWGVVTLFETDTGKPLWRTQTGRKVVSALAFPPHQQELAAGDQSGQLVRVTAADGRIFERATLPSEVNSLVYSGECDQLLAGTNEGGIYRWVKGKDPELVATLGRLPVRLLVLASSGGHLWAGTREALYLLSDHGRTLRRLEGLGEVTALALGPAPDTMLVGLRSGELQLRHALDGRPLRHLGTHEGAVMRACVVDGGQRIAVVTVRTLTLLDTQTGDVVFDHSCASLHPRDVGFRAETGAIILAGQNRCFDALEVQAPLGGHVRRALVRQAVDLVLDVIAEKPILSDGRAAVAAATGVTATVREEALSILEHLGEHANMLNSRAWAIVANPNASDDEVARALRFSRRACELLPNNHALLNTLGVALYRVGELHEALEVIERCVTWHDRIEPSLQTLDHAMHALIYAGLGRLVLAREACNRAAASLRAAGSGGTARGEAGAFVEIAEQVVGEEEAQLAAPLRAR